MRKLGTLTKEKLIDLYVTNKRSLGDMAGLYGVSRTAIYKKLKEYGIRQRSKSEARLEAEKQGKITQQFFDINENFFDKWSPEMAYVFGLIITDGCMSKAGTVSLCINDRELLEKVKNVMGSEHKITPSNHQKGLYYYHFTREKITNDLLRLGVTPRKSLTVKFPNVPAPYLPDFIRGVFDGDGSVFFEKRITKFPLRAKFVSGSEAFITGLRESLEQLGLPRAIYRQKTKNGYSYSIVFGHKDSIELAKILYKNAPNSLFLERKHSRFIEGMKRAATE